MLRLISLISPGFFAAADFGCRVDPGGTADDSVGGGFGVWPGVDMCGGSVGVLCGYSPRGRSGFHPVVTDGR
jgi:hypothetical protein